MLLNSYAPFCFTKLTPCPDDHGPALHVTVGLQATDGLLREYPDRHVCPGGITEGAVWFGAALDGLLEPGDAPLSLCDALDIYLIAADEEQYGLVVQVPGDVGEPPVDCMGLLVSRAELIPVAQYWQQQAETVVRLTD